MRIRRFLASSSPACSAQLAPTLPFDASLFLFILRQFAKNVAKYFTEGKYAEMSHDIDKKALELKSAGTTFCVASVVKVKGSSPRHVGAKMIVTAGSSFGTIGGGALEHRVIEDARELMKKRVAECKNYPLGALLGQCCGGEVDIFFEPVIPPKEIYVFGAGHIAEALCPLLFSMGYKITLIDERPERINLPIFDCTAEKWNDLPSDVFRQIKFDDSTHIIVITHEHKHDEEIVRFCLDKPFKYLGCIGSRTKWEKFKARYRAQGFTDEQFARTSTPIGLDIGAETPLEIAVAIAAQLIQLHAKPKDYAEGIGHF